MSLLYGPVNLNNKFNVNGNYIVFNIENLLKDWPTYMIEFMPQNPGPVKLLLHLRDASKLRWIDDADSEAEDMIPQGTRRKTQKNSSNSSASALKADPNTTLLSETLSKMASEPGSATLIAANPVQFLGVLEDPPVKNRKFADEGSVWPPRCSRAYRDILDLPLTAFRSLRILPAAVEAINDSPV